MKVLHVTNEVSKKNFSISSLIIFFINTLEKVYPDINSQLLISNVENDFIKLNNLEKFEEKNYKIKIFIFKVTKIIKKLRFCSYPWYMGPYSNNFHFILLYF